MKFVNRIFNPEQVAVGNLKFAVKFFQRFDYFLFRRPENLLGRFRRREEFGNGQIGIRAHNAALQFEFDFVNRFSVFKFKRVFLVRFVNLNQDRRFLSVDFGVVEFNKGVYRVFISQIEEQSFFRGKHTHRLAMRKTKRGGRVVDVAFIARLFSAGVAGASASFRTSAGSPRAALRHVLRVARFDCPNERQISARRFGIISVCEIFNVYVRYSVEFCVVLIENFLQRERRNGIERRVGKE